MKSFQFNLSRVLDVRSMEEKITRNKLLEEKRRASIIENELENLNNKQEKVYSYLRENSTDIVDVEILQARSFLHRHRQRIKQVKEKLSVQLTEVEKCNVDYIEKKKNKEIIEKLKEKDLQQYRKELLRKEQKIIDEINQKVKGTR